MKFVLENLYLILIALASGGMLLWPLVRRDGSGAVTPAQTTQLINQRNALVIDVRGDEAFAGGSVTGARHLPLAAAATRAQEFARFKSRPLVLVCDAGREAPRAVDAFKAQGFEEVHVLAGGLAAWKQAGLPLVQAQREAGRTEAKPQGRGRGRQPDQGRVPRDGPRDRKDRKKGQGNDRNASSMAGMVVDAEADRAHGNGSPPMRPELAMIAAPVLDEVASSDASSQVVVAPAATTDRIKEAS